MKPNQNNRFYFAQGLTVGFLTFVLNQENPFERIAYLFKELIESYRILRIDPVEMFTQFQFGIENNMIKWSDIDKLLDSLKDEPELLGWVRSSVDKIFERQ